MHSHLTDAERGAYWRRIAGGQVQVVVGARSAVFAPTRKLGLIIIDEEHENTFEQESTPRYHARRRRRDAGTTRRHSDSDGFGDAELRKLGERGEGATTRC